MTDISALEGRIAAALNRIQRGLEARSDGAVQTDMQAKLDKERAAREEVIESARALKELQDGQIADLTARLTAQTEKMALLDEELQRLRGSNTQLREMNAAMRKAVTEGLAPQLVDAAREAEMAALVAQRSAEATEIATLLATLKPMIEDGPNAAG